MSSLLSRNIEEAKRVLTSLQAFDRQVTAAADHLARSLRNGRKLMACGNGGSAADAAHLTTEFVCRFNRDRRPYPAVCLAVHGGDLTAIGNDYTFQDVFARQVCAFGQEGDTLMAFSTSGDSENIVRALNAAKNVQAKTVAFLGRGGGRCIGLADVDIIVPSNSTARVQEAHKVLLHTICELVEPQLGVANEPLPSI